MAPEMISGEGHSYAVDFWIVGVMLYEMLYHLRRAS
jgi:serine/threonine protein kinase